LTVVQVLVIVMHKKRR